MYSFFLTNPPSIQQRPICDASLVKDPNPSAAILEKIADKALQELAEAYASYDDFSLVREHTTALIGVIRRNKFKIDFKEIIFRRFYELGSFFTLVLLLSEYADSSTLAKHSSSEFWLYRYAIAQNSQTPDRILELLTQDNNRIVKAAAEDITVR